MGPTTRHSRNAGNKTGFVPEEMGYMEGIGLAGQGLAAVYGTHIASEQLREQKRQSRRAEAQRKLVNKNQAIVGNNDLANHISAQSQMQGNNFGSAAHNAAINGRPILDGGADGVIPSQVAYKEQHSVFNPTNYQNPNGLAPVQAAPADGTQVAGTQVAPNTAAQPTVAGAIQSRMQAQPGQRSQLATPENVKRYA